MGAADALANDYSDFGTPYMRLPASMQGSQRDLYGRYLDAMAMLRQISHNGRADFFITFTCNPKWPEIMHALKKGETASDRPDLVARVFLLKLNKLLKLLKEKHLLGYVTGLVSVIEHQKRYPLWHHVIVTHC
jgi:hypothetical protein